MGITNGSERTWTVAENAASTVTGGRKIEEMVMGDVLILETNAKGEIDRYNVIFDSQKMTEGRVFVGGNGYASESASDTTVYLGNIFYMDNSYIRLKYGSDFITFNVSSDYLVYRYQKGTQPGEKGRVTVASKNDIKYSEFADAAENSKILLHANRNTIKTVIIYE